MEAYSKSLRQQLFQYIGPRYFIALPHYLRDFRLDFAHWKTLFNDFLRKIPDTPKTPDLVSDVCDISLASPSNSIIKWIPHRNLTDRRGNMTMF